MCVYYKSKVYWVGDCQGHLFTEREKEAEDLGRRRKEKREIKWRMTLNFISLTHLPLVVHYITHSWGECSFPCDLLASLFVLVPYPLPPPSSNFLWHWISPLPSVTFKDEIGFVWPQTAAYVVFDHRCKQFWVSECAHRSVEDCFHFLSAIFSHLWEIYTIVKLLYISSCQFSARMGKTAFVRFTDRARWHFQHGRDWNTFQTRTASPH